MKPRKRRRNRKILFDEDNYIEKYYYHDDKVVIPLLLEKISDLYMKHDYKQMELAYSVCDYIEEIAYMVPVNIDIEIEIHCPKVNMATQKRIKDAIKNNYGMEIDELEYDMMMKNRKSIILSIVGILILALYILIASAVLMLLVKNKELNAVLSSLSLIALCGLFPVIINFIFFFINEIIFFINMVECDNVKFVVELKAGQCEKNNISVGDTIQINAEGNTPMPVKCDDIVYEDGNILLTKIWTCPKCSIFTDKEDGRKLFLHNWDALTYIDLDGNFLYSRKKENERDGLPVRAKFNPEWLRVKKHEETDFDKDGWKIVTDFDENIGRRVAKIVDRNGNEKFPSKYSYIGPERNGYRAVSIDGPDKENVYKGCKDGFVDSDGKEIIPCGEYEDIEQSFYENSKLFGFKENGKWGISDFNRNVWVEPRYSVIRLWESRGLAYVQDDDKKCGLVTLNGKMVLPIKYNKIYGLIDNYIMCHTDCKTEMFIVKVKNNE